MGAPDRAGASGTGPVPGPTSRSATGAHLRRWTRDVGVRLLVVDPEGDADLLSEAMMPRGVHVTWVRNTLDGLIAFGRLDPHAVLVAAVTPGIAAADFVARIRRHAAPFVIAADDGAADDGTADDGAAAGERCAGPAQVPVAPLLLAGAAAVVPRPYEPGSLWRLLARGPRTLVEHARLEVGPIELDAGAFTVRVHGERIADLPLKEFELLRTLMLRSPEVVGDAELRDALWGARATHPGGNTIAMHVTRLRARLGPAVVVRRVRGRGYALDPGRGD